MTKTASITQLLHVGSGYQELIVEMDELWTFVGKKKCTRWLWIALEHKSRKALAWVLEDRTEITTFELWERLSLSSEQRLNGTFCTDLWSTYN